MPTFRLSLACKPNVGHPARGEGRPPVMARARDMERAGELTRQIVVTDQLHLHTIKGPTQPARTEHPAITRHPPLPDTAARLHTQHRLCQHSVVPLGIYHPLMEHSPHRLAMVAHLPSRREEGTVLPRVTVPRELLDTLPQEVEVMGHMEVEVAFQQVVAMEGQEDLLRVAILAGHMAQLHHPTMLLAMVPQGVVMAEPQGAVTVHMEEVAVHLHQVRAMEEHMDPVEGDLPRVAMMAQRLVYMARQYLQMLSLCRTKRVSDSLLLNLRHTPDFLSLLSLSCFVCAGQFGGKVITQPPGGRTSINLFG